MPRVFEPLEHQAGFSVCQAVQPWQEERWQPREVGASEGARCGTVIHQGPSCTKTPGTADLESSRDQPGHAAPAGPKTRRFPLESTAILGGGLVSAVGIFKTSRPKGTGISIDWACQGMRVRRTREGPCLHNGLRHLLISENLNPRPPTKTVFSRFIKTCFRTRRYTFKVKEI